MIFLNVVCAQQQVPHISGKVNINLADGVINCNFNLSNLPDLGKQYKLLLYRGFNIKFIRNDTGKVLNYDGFYESKLQGEAVAYLPQIKNDTLSLSHKLNVSYTGAFPVYTDTLNAFDFKGFIAFNGKTVRATEQSKWYPTIYSVKDDQELSDVTYDINIECQDCKTIYLNGSQAQSGPKARFITEKPRPMFLFAGNYSAQILPNSTFLNASLSPQEAEVFNRNIKSITDFYTGYLNLSYGEKNTFLQHEAVEPYGRGRSWGFVTYPTIAIAGENFKDQVNLKTGLFADTSTYHFYAHELGHYYFGKLLQPNSTLKWFFNESMAEFLAVKATEAKYGTITTKKFIASKKTSMTDWKIVPLSQIIKAESIGDDYRYDYGPLILLAMEHRFGKKNVELFCRRSIQNIGKSTDYTFLLNMIKEAGINDHDWKLFESQVIDLRDGKKIFNYL